MSDFVAFVIGRISPEWSDPAVITILEMMVIAPIIGGMSWFWTWTAGYYTRSRAGEL
ncbi:MAG: hypothetical protein OEQ29_08940 [Alphaproteobacteria bacterium]|nr:hypothetical protein [Alphaproteobacteria bacterium]